MGAMSVADQYSGWGAIGFEAGRINSKGNYQGTSCAALIFFVEKWMRGRLKMCVIDGVSRRETGDEIGV